ncbi:D-alanine transfer protein [Lachnospiraceae bacterium C7]|nr:D-alanine transfer protein [Lachnospiraceae bacterium C7]
MKKIKALAVAGIIFALLITCFENSLTYNMKSKNYNIGMWNSEYKDKSYDAISQNINDKTMIICGSSEFGHGRNTVYHPMNMCSESKNWITIGSSYNQSILHAIAVGSVGKQMNGKKVTILLSPTWFYKKGISPSHFEMRFSESEYYHFMENKDIPTSLKKYVAKRSEKLLKNNEGLQSKVKLCNNINLKKDKSKFAGTKYDFQKKYSRQKEYITVKTALMLSQNKIFGELKNSIKSNKVVNALDDFEDSADNDLTLKDAKKASISQSHNEYMMRDKSFMKLKPRLKQLKGSHLKDTWDESPEYSDLECFIKVCNSQNIDVQLILLPVNGKWYDYTGMTKDKRQVLSKNLDDIAKKYNVRYDDLSKLDYEEYITSDAVHPWNLGWIKINERMKEFYYEKGGSGY